MAIGIGADYAVYFIFRVREEFERTGDLRQATATALTTSGKAIAYVASAVAGGYLCLALSLFKVHVLLGVLVALTMVTSSAATVAFLPSVLLLVKPRFLKRGRWPSHRPASVARERLALTPTLSRKRERELRPSPKGRGRSYS